MSIMIRGYIYLFFYLFFMGNYITFISVILINYVKIHS